MQLPSPSTPRRPRARCGYGRDWTPRRASLRRSSVLRDRRRSAQSGWTAGRLSTEQRRTRRQLARTDRLGLSLGSCSTQPHRDMGGTSCSSTLRSTQSELPNTAYPHDHPDNGQQFNHYDRNKSSGKLHPRHDFLLVRCPACRHTNVQVLASGRLSEQQDRSIYPPPHERRSLSCGQSALVCGHRFSTSIHRELLSTASALRSPA